MSAELWSRTDPNIPVELLMPRLFEDLQIFEPESRLGDMSEITVSVLYWRMVTMLVGS